MDQVINWEHIKARASAPMEEPKRIWSKTLVTFMQGLHWWLIDDVLKEAASGANKDGTLAKMCGQPFDPLPEDVGCCWILYAKEDPKACPWLRDALLLPMRWADQWRSSEPARHDPRLPTRVHDLANQVIEGLYDPYHRLRRWRLTSLLDKKFNLSDFDWPADSGGGALAAGLWAAIRGSGSNRKVWASVAWDHGELSSVRELDKKLKLAADWGAERFYVANDQKVATIVNDLPTPQGTRLVVCNLDPRSHDLDPGYRSRAERSLAPMLAEFHIKPEVQRDSAGKFIHENLKKCRDYYLGMTIPAEANDYYYSNLIDAVAEGCREKFDALLPAAQTEPVRPRLVTILSPSLVSLVAAMIVRPSACLALRTERGANQDLDPDDWLEPHIQKLEEWFDEKLCANLGCQNLDIRRFDRKADLGTTFRNLVGAFTRKNPHGLLIFDVTSGTTRMKITLASLASSDDRLLVIDHDLLGKKNRPIPLTEAPVLFGPLAAAALP
jgi:hypothetical protein